MEDKAKRTELDEVGEFGLIDMIKNTATLRNESSVKGIGDDAAVIDVGNKYMVITSDMLVEQIHFDLSYFPLKHLGYKAVAVNVSDIAAMNATPKQITVSIGVSNRFSVEAIEELYEGIAHACEAYKVDLVGGDTTSSSSGLVISITAIGEVAKEEIAYRSTAQENDILCVTGDLGAAYLGLQMLKREKEVFMANPEMQPELKNYEYLVQRHLKPQARMDVIHELRDLKIVPTSMIDISDGLASELLHISKSSGLGLDVFTKELPINNDTLNAAMELSLDPITCAINGGEDFELLFTIKQSDHDKIKNHPEITLIGHMTKAGEKANLVMKSGAIVPLTAQGWKHF